MDAQFPDELESPGARADGEEGVVQCDGAPGTAGSPPTATLRHTTPRVSQK